MTGEESYHGLRRMLVESVRTLAADADQQLRHIDALGAVSIDELGLELDDVWPGIRESRRLRPQEKAAIDELYEYIDSMSGEANAALWTEDGVRTAAEWRRVRDLAAVALRELSDP